MTGTELHALRTSLGMTLGDIAAYLGLRHPSQALHLESGRTAITGAKLHLLVLLKAAGGPAFVNLLALLSAETPAPSPGLAPRPGKRNPASS